MMKCEITFPIPLPDDPQKWDGWSKYKSPNFYERLCLDPHANPSNELIEEHCRELLRWWQKKLPLKNQPSNPLSQLLRPGLDESSHYLSQARVELLDPDRRRQMDDEIAARVLEEAVVEFQKYVVFALADGVLTAEGERNLLRFGAQQGLSAELMAVHIEAGLKDNGAQRVQPVAAPAPAPAPARSSRRQRSLAPQEDFMRMLRLSGLDDDSMTDDQRDAFINMAENLGLEADEAEDMVDSFLEEASGVSDAASPPPPRIEVAEAARKTPPKTEAPPPAQTPPGRLAGSRPPIKL